MSRTLPIMFQNANLYQRQSKITPDGIEVTKTSDAPTLAETLRQHSQEVSQFVQDGIPCMGRGMAY